MTKDVCIPQEALAVLLAHCGALEARIAELTRPKQPEDFGLVGVRLTATEQRIVMALLPPGEAVHHDAIVRRAWPDIEAAGLVGSAGNLVRSNMSRVRLGLRPSGWRVGSLHYHGLYVLLAPDMPLPEGYRDHADARPPAPQVKRRVPCPTCTGTMARYSIRCRACHLGRGKRPWLCPACKGPRSANKRARLCWECELARRRGLLKGWQAA